MVTFIVLVVLGLIPAFIAKKKGKNFFVWWFFGAILFIVALPLSLMCKSEHAEQDTWSSANGSLPKHARSDTWPSANGNIQFKHLYDGTGIALDTDNQIIYLKNGKLQKSYPFSEIREWKYNVQSGGTIIGGGFRGLGHNLGTVRNNKKSSGLFISVRDIENPQWRVAFPYNTKMEGELLKWMEIFNQYVNNE